MATATEVTFSLSDDGTMDTVVTCNRCGKDERYTFSGETEETYEEFVEWALEDAAETHECDEDDVCTHSEEDERLGLCDHT